MIAASGIVFDASAVASSVMGGFVALSWISVAVDTFAFTVYVPSLALSEVAVVHPDANLFMADLTDLTQAVHIEQPTPAISAAVRDILRDSGCWDPAAAWAVHVARTRGWSIVSSDPDRLHRIDPTITIESIPA